MIWERIRLVFAWPLLVIGSPFVLLAACIGGTGMKFALADFFEQIMEGGSEKSPRPYSPVSETPRDRQASRTARREIEIARSPESAYALVYAEAQEASYPEIKAF